MEECGQLYAAAALPQVKNPTYPLYRKLDEPQSLSERGDKEKHSQHLLGIEPQSIPYLSPYTD